MGLFGKKKPKAPSWKVEMAKPLPKVAAQPSKPSPTDGRVAACPYCGVVLKKIPGAATTCPECHLKMFVKTDPRDHVRRVVTLNQAQEIDDEYAKRNGTWEFIKAKRDQEEATRARLGEKWHMAPEDVSAQDVEWSIVNENMLNAAKYGNWQELMFTFWDRANAEIARGLTERGATSMLTACLLRANGATDLRPNGEDLSAYVEPFSPDLDSEALKREVSRVKKVFNDLGLSPSEGLTRCGESIERGLPPLPVSWDEVKVKLLLLLTK